MVLEKAGKTRIFTVLMYIIIFLYGIVIGSFLNVCILRIPEGKSIVTERSHCMSCGYVLKWYDMFPVFSYLFLGGKCRQCGNKISVQYPLIETANGLLWVISFACFGVTWDMLLICFLFSSLLTLSIIDLRTYEIPFGINVFIGILGLIRMSIDYRHWSQYVIGFFAVSIPLLIIFLATKGRGIGGGDVKLMAAAGLFLGWQSVLLAFILGCFYGSVIHIARMKIAGEGRILAMGPYLAMGIATALVFGDRIIEWYISMF